MRGGDHNDAAPPDEALYWQTIGSFLERAQSNMADRRSHKKFVRPVVPGKSSGLLSDRPVSGQSLSRRCL